MDFGMVFMDGVSSVMRVRVTKAARKKPVLVVKPTTENSNPTMQLHNKDSTWAGVEITANIHPCRCSSVFERTHPNSMEFTCGKGIARSKRVADEDAPVLLLNSMSATNTKVVTNAAHIAVPTCTLLLHLASLRGSIR